MDYMLLFQPHEIDPSRLCRQPRSAASEAGQRRPVRCMLMERDVEVEFITHGFLGLRWPVGVRSCTAFDPPTDVSCRRRCVDASFRNQWKPGLPLELE